MYKESEMVYKDYKKTAKADNDNPKIIQGNDHAELNRTEAYEMLYFINSLAKTWWENPTIGGYQKIEKTIRTKVPTNIRTHSDIKQWIEANHKSFWDSI